MTSEDAHSVPPHGSPEPDEIASEAKLGLIGAHRAVIRLAKRTGLRIARAEISSLLEQGLLAASGEFHGHPLYDVNSLDAIDPVHLSHLVIERERWLQASMDERTTARTVGLPIRELRELAKVRDIKPGRFDRYANHDVETLVTFQRNNQAESRTLSDTRRAIRQWANRMLEAGVAVLLDIETATYDNGICEIAIVAACSGEILIDSLVEPGMPISDATRRVHGIRDADLSSAPRLHELLPRLLDFTHGRQILAYNSEYDRNVLINDCRRLRLDAHELGDPANWCCLMGRRMEWLGTDKGIPLGAAHRAKADCLAARSLLQQFSTTV